MSEEFQKGRAEFQVERRKYFQLLVEGAIENNDKDFIEVRELAKEINISVPTVIEILDNHPLAKRATGRKKPVIYDTTAAPKLEFTAAGLMAKEEFDREGVQAYYADVERGRMAMKKKKSKSVKKYF